MVVLTETLNGCGGGASVVNPPVPNVPVLIAVNGLLASAALAVLNDAVVLIMAVRAAGRKVTPPKRSQSPGVSVMEVKFVLISVVSGIEVTIDSIFSPTEPAVTDAPDLLPAIPAGYVGETSPFALSVVKAAAAGTVNPIVIPLIVPPDATSAVVAWAIVAYVDAATEAIKYCPGGA